MTTDNIGTIILIAVISVSLFYLFGYDPIQNEGTLQMRDQVKQQNYITNDGSAYCNDTDDPNDSDDSDGSKSDDSNQISVDDMNRDDSVDSSLEIIHERARGRNNLHFNRVLGGKYKKSSYKDINSGFPKALEKNFDVADITKNYTDKYQPLDVSGTDNAAISLADRKKETEKDKYNVDSFLPKETNRDWFETIETVDVKNAHLINIYRPIGVNTIGSTHKNSAYDIRGTGGAICPKFVVSPWLQSTIEPDRSTKQLC